MMLRRLALSLKGKKRPQANYDILFIEGISAIWLSYLDDGKIDIGEFIGLDKNFKEAIENYYTLSNRHLLMIQIEENEKQRQQEVERKAKMEFKRGFDTEKRMLRERQEKASLEVKKPQNSSLTQHDIQVLNDAIQEDIERLEKFLAALEKEIASQPFYSRRIVYEHPSIKDADGCGISWIVGLWFLILAFILSVAVGVLIVGLILASIGVLLILGSFIGSSFSIKNGGPERFNDAPFSFFSTPLKTNLQSIQTKFRSSYDFCPMPKVMNIKEKKSNRLDNNIYIRAEGQTLYYQVHHQAERSIPMLALRRELDDDQAHLIFEALADENESKFNRVNQFKPHLLRIIARQGEILKIPVNDIKENNTISEVRGKIKENKILLEKEKEKRDKIAFFQASTDKENPIPDGKEALKLG